MRFVSPETDRLELSNGQWIEVKRELTVGEEKRYRTAGFKGVRGKANAEGDANIDVDFAAMAMARAKAYIVDWSARDGKDKPVKYTEAALENLDSASFDEIDTAIQAHIEAQAPAEGKSASTTGAASS